MTRFDLSNEFSRAEKYFFWKGRVGLFALLKGCGITKGDEVILQSFTCVAVPNPVLYTGAVPVYVDIDPQTYTASTSAIIESITRKTKAIILQNSFGHPPDYDEVMKVAAEKGICVIGDCAHGAGSKYKGRHDGFIADASIFSFQWTKPVTTGLGGCAVVQRKERFPLLDSVISGLIKPSRSEQLTLDLQRFLYAKLMSPKTYWSLVSAYRGLRHMGLQVSSSSSEETEGTTCPKNFFKGMSDKQVEVAERAMRSLQEKVKARKESANTYNHYCEKYGIAKAFVADYADHSYLRYPIEVGSNKLSFKVAEKNKIQLGEWFRTPIDPATELSNWIYEYGSCPIAESACRRIINLPTEMPLTEKQFLLVLN